MNLPFILIHGYNGQGKSTLAHTVPGPILSLDFEGRSRMLRGKTCIEWDDFEPGKTRLKEDHVVFVNLESYDEYQDMVDYLREGDHPFKGVVLDSLLILQEEIKDTLIVPSKGGDNHAGNYDFWGTLKQKLLREMKALQKLTLPTSAQPVSVVVVCPTNRDDEKPKRPDIEGGARRRMIGLFDLVGASVKIKEDGDYRFRLEIDLDDYESDEFEVKCDIDEVTEALRELEDGEVNVIWDPDLTEDVVNKMNPSK